MDEVQAAIIAVEEKAGQRVAAQEETIKGIRQNLDVYDEMIKASSEDAEKSLQVRSCSFPFYLPSLCS